MRAKGFSHVRWILVGFLFAALVACGSILGIGEPTLGKDAGAGDGGKDSTTGGGGGDGSTDGEIDGGELDAEPDGTTDGAEDSPCAAGQALCGAVCVDTQTDPSNCNGCGTTCPTGQACVAGACTLTCPAGQSVCGGGDGGEAGAGTCSDLQTDILNCGTCGAPCPVAHNTPTCATGSCGVGTCATGFFDCNNSATDGCEVNLLADGNNCGVCGNVCPTGQVCANGTCGVSCPTGQAICREGPDGGFLDAGNGPAYCADTTTDIVNCGACGVTCPVNNNTPSCNGTCQIGTCNPGFADCNGDPSDGCEVNTNTDLANCGTCTHACTAAGASVTCSGGTCSITTCNTGLADCNHTYSDGCEVNTTTDPANCGGCGTVCANTCTTNVTGTTCAGSACKVTTCSPTFYDTDNTCADGCECKASTVATCAAPGLLTLTGLGASVNATGNLVPTAGTDTWWEVTFTGSNRASTYHPRVVFMTNPASEYVFDVETNCSGGNLACTEKFDAGPEAGAFEHSTGLTQWETSYNVGVDFVDSGFVPIPAVGTIFIHVYRASGAPVDCNPYTLTVSN